ncbi:MAG: sugar ABC transporter permease [Dehalococcoidales bacterium]|nr:sugar ABC transporter permease [Dehalococcoidales bacterium]
MQAQQVSPDWRRRRTFRWGRRETRIALLFLSPAIVYFVLFFALPILMDFAMTFTSGTLLLGGSGEVVGLKNYIALLDDRVFHQSLITTAIFMLGGGGTTIVLGLALALLLNRRMRFRIAFRAVIFFPYMTSMVIIALIWSVIFDKQLGILNYLLSLVGIPPVGWLNDPNMALLAIIIVTVWWQTGYNMVLFLAGLQAIPSEYYDAAKVDGAGAIARFVNITFPMLAPTTFFVVIITIISTSEAFIQPYIMTLGGPANATNIASYYIYNVAFTHMNLGYASAIAFAMFAITFAITAVLFRWWRAELEY